MTKAQQEKSGISVENHYHGDTYIGAQSIGDNNKVKGKIKTQFSYADKQEISALQKAVSDLMLFIESSEADFAIKSKAHVELQQINEHLANLENATPETKGKVRELLTSVKDGTLGAIQLGKDIKEANEVTFWLMEKAAVVSALLAPMM